jgi:hypothetical protein
MGQLVLCIVVLPMINIVIDAAGACIMFQAHTGVSAAVLLLYAPDL